MLEKKLDNKTLALWFREKSQDEGSTFQQWQKFIDRRIFELEESRKDIHSITQPKSGRNQMRTYTTTIHSCPICKEDHQLYACEKFKGLTTKQKWDEIKKHNRCFNCLHEGCNYKKCKSSSCRECDQRHNTLLHIEASNNGSWQQRKTEIPGVDTAYKNIGNPNLSVNVSQSHQRSYVMLPTAGIYVLDKYGMAQPCRALLDSGSQGTLISESCAQRLRLERTYDKTLLYGVNSNQGTQSRGRLQLIISSETGMETIRTEALCLTNLTQTLPPVEITSEKLKYFTKLKLADNCFNKPGKIDVIIGADIFTKCCLAKTLVHPSGNPTAMETIFGWVLLGETSLPETSSIMFHHTSLLDEQLQRFWSLEEIPETVHQLTPEEEAAEEHYRNNTTRMRDGRYVVRLPFINNKVDLGESKSIALRRFINVERRCRSQPELQKEYTHFMEQYQQLGHMKPTTTSNNTHNCYLPHHAVYKESSTTTKVRILFDASCHTSNGKSLNDNLLIGAKQQNELFDIIIRFRKYEIGFIGDIEKMYRQVAKQG